jgi:hypothetical protein
MRPVSITEGLRRSSIVGVGVGNFNLEWSVRQTLSLSSANARKFSPCADLAFARYYSQGSRWQIVEGIQELGKMVHCRRRVEGAGWR